MTEEEEKKNHLPNNNRQIWEQWSLVSRAGTDEDVDSSPSLLRGQAARLFCRAYPDKILPSAKVTCRSYLDGAEARFGPAGLFI